MKRLLLALGLALGVSAPALGQGEVPPAVARLKATTSWLWSATTVGIAAKEVSLPLAARRP